MLWRTRLLGIVKREFFSAERKGFLPYKKEKHYKTLLFLLNKVKLLFKIRLTGNLLSAEQLFIKK
jgi:hypothetical protein